MSAPKILTVIGTRPEVIKMAPVIQALRAHGGFDARTCVTGQHRELLDQAIGQFDLEIDHDLSVMKPDQDLFDLSASLLQGLKSILAEDPPDLVLVHGDTTTCFMAALTAFYSGVPVGHVEAGLRTYDWAAPYPEEANRTLAAQIARYHFAPTTRAKQNLLKENINETRIWVTGNTSIDALFQMKARLKNSQPDLVSPELTNAVNRSQASADGRLVAITGHRRENFGEKLADACTAIATLAANHPAWQFVYPVHLNPRVKGPVEEILGRWENVVLLPPLDYGAFVWLMDQSDLILTDSGGVQEEAPSLGKPVLVMRDVTERPEAVDAGTVKVIGTGTTAIVETVEALMTDRALYQRMATAINPYGDGRAADRIVGILAQELLGEEFSVLPLAG